MLIRLLIVIFEFTLLNKFFFSKLLNLNYLNTCRLFWFCFSCFQRSLFIFFYCCGRFFGMWFFMMWLFMMWFFTMFFMMWFFMKRLFIMWFFYYNLLDSFYLQIYIILPIAAVSCLSPTVSMHDKIIITLVQYDVILSYMQTCYIFCILCFACEKQ